MKTNGHKPKYNAYALREGGGWCYVRLEAGRIVEASAVSCAWSGTQRFHEWFTRRFSVSFIVPFAGVGSSQ